MQIIVSLGAEPPVPHKPGGFEIVGGRQQYRAEVPFKPGGPPSVMIVVPGREPAYLTADEAEAAGKALLEKASELRAKTVAP
jgi:hypothetical protein